MKGKMVADYNNVLIILNEQNAVCEKTDKQ